jgi:Uma2 family endonuclease
VTVATQLLESKIFLTPLKRKMAWPESSELWPSAKLNELPTMYDLPSENKTEEPALDEYHDIQADLLRECFYLKDCPPDQIFTAADMYLYYDSTHPRWYKRADWFAVVGVSRLYKGVDLRQSYVVWDEGVAPYIVAEFLSRGTKDEDLGHTLQEPGKPPPKWKVYEQILKIPYYLIFDEEDKESKLQVYKLVNKKYRELTITNNRLWMPELKIGIGVWYGSYQGMTRKWLRWYDANGEWLLTPLEQAELQIEQERREKEKLAAKLRELGIDPTTIA